MAFTKIAAAGIGSTETVTLHSLEVLNNATVGGVLTYEDVTNVDSIGIVTARAGVLVGSGITLSKDGDVFFTGIATGNGSGLTALNASNISSGTVPTARLGSGTASSSTFLRGDSTFQTVNTDLVSDTSPQLGGNLDVNTKNILLADSGSASDDRIIFGTGSDLHIYFDGSNSYIKEPNSVAGQLIIDSYNGTDIRQGSTGELMGRFVGGGAVELYQDNNRKFSTTSQGAAIGQVSTIPTMDSFSCQIQAGNSGFIGNYHSGSNQQLILGLNQYYQSGYKAPDNNVSQQLQFYNKKFNFLTAPAPGSDNGAVTNTQILAIDGDGVKFGTDTAAANALDDYEEGTAVPDFANADNSIVTVNHYHYTKVGRLVHFEAIFTVGSNNDGSGFGFSLPVAQAGSRETVIPAISNRSSPNNPFAFVVNANQSYAYAKALQGFSGTNVEYVDFVGSIILVSGTYEAA